MTAGTKRSRRSYSAGEWGRNRVRIFSDPRTGLIQIEWREDGRRLTLVAQASRLGQSQETGGRIRRQLRPTTAPGPGEKRARATHPGEAF